MVTWIPVAGVNISWQDAKQKLILKQTTTKKNSLDMQLAVIDKSQGE